MFRMANLTGHFYFKNGKHTTFEPKYLTNETSSNSNIEK